MLFQNGMLKNIMQKAHMFTAYSFIWHFKTHSLDIIKFFYINEFAHELFEDTEDADDVYETYSEENVVKKAIFVGDLNVLKWLHKNTNLKIKKNAIDKAASNGHLHVIKWLHENTYQICDFAMNNAIVMGHLHVIKWLHENRPDSYCVKQSAALALKRKHFEVVKWLVENKNIGLAELNLTYEAYKKLHNKN